MEQIYNKFFSVNRVTAEFIQIKKSKAFIKEQIQKGSFESSKDGKLIWEISQPVKSIFTVNGNQAKISYPELNYEKIIDLNAEKNIGEVIKNIFAIVSVQSTKKIIKEYDCSIDGSWKKGWKVTLKPKNNIVKKAISRIMLTITEKEFITSIEISEGNGDSTIIKFYNIKLFTVK